MLTDKLLYLNIENSLQQSARERGNPQGDNNVTPSKRNHSHKTVLPPLSHKTLFSRWLCWAKPQSASVCGFRGLLCCEVRECASERSERHPLNKLVELPCKPDTEDSKTNHAPPPVILAFTAGVWTQRRHHPQVFAWQHSAAHSDSN